MKITKILIANRGEIAVRVIKACREMGIATVAIYSEADRKALHVIRADEALCVGGSAPGESYLNIENILEAARLTGCQAIHPGYGFLSENAEFVRRCHKAGLIFIGPSASAMEKVGDKIAARQTMAAAGIPLTPGVEIDQHSLEDVRKHAQKIGYPVMIKASAGGGGKGMRIVHQPGELESAISAGRREAQNAFGDDTVYMEKFIERPRHIEFQVIADQHGNMVHLFERECSIQRRHQKIVEESPSATVDEDLRRRMGEAACKVMKAVDYTNAGTVEFLLDANRDFYFLEVNARIQVEHPVTEMVTGIDLVQLQIRIAGGEKLPFGQQDLSQKGHAIECRVYAEDPENNFMPSIGKLHLVREPQGPGIRCDSGIFTGAEVTMFYDPILAKLIVHAENREAAISRMLAALNDFVLLGVVSPISFLKEIVGHPQFKSADLDTGFIGQYFADWKQQVDDYELQSALVAAAVVSGQTKKPSFDDGQFSARKPTPWQILGEWQLLGPNLKS